MSRFRETLRRLVKSVGRKPNVVERLCFVNEGEMPQCNQREYPGENCLVIVEKMVTPERQAKDES